MLLPLFAMVLLTFVVMALMGRARLQAVRRRELSVGYFRLMSGDEPPAAVVKTGRHYANLFEMPVLFYAAGCAYLALGLQQPVLEALAWLFVAARAAQASNVAPSIWTASPRSGGWSN